MAPDEPRTPGAAVGLRHPRRRQQPESVQALVSGLNRRDGRQVVSCPESEPPAPRIRGISTGTRLVFAEARASPTRRDASPTRGRGRSLCLLLRMRQSTIPRTPDDHPSSSLAGQLSMQIAFRCSASGGFGGVSEAQRARARQLPWCNPAGANVGIVRIPGVALGSLARLHRPKIATG